MKKIFTTNNIIIAALIAVLIAGLSYAYYLYTIGQIGNY